MGIPDGNLLLQGDSDQDTLHLGEAQEGSQEAGPHNQFRVLQGAADNQTRGQAAAESGVGLGGDLSGGRETVSG